MPLFDTGKQRAALAILLLAFGLAVAIAPYATGLLGAPVLYVLFSPLHRWLARKLPASVAAGLVIFLAFLLIILPGTWLIGLLVDQAQNVVKGLVNSPLLSRVAKLRVGRLDVGPQLATLGKELLSWLGGSALGFIGTATRFALNLIFSFFGLYYLLLNPAGAWAGVQPYIPFSRENVDLLRERFRSVTVATVIGTGATALIQGVMVGAAFAVTGLGDPLFWGVVTSVFAILPVVGSGLVWGPGAISLAIEGNTVGAIGLAVVGLLAGQVHTLIGPMITRRYAQIHPMITLVGAIAGVSYFGLLGLLLGPLALSYFFELIRMYRQEYLTA
jgi:predicted PurR-regulated permease PerM